MAFNADEYIGVIVEQIASNFRELDETVEACKELQKKEKKFRNSYELMKYAKLDAEINEKKTNLGDVICNKYKSIEPLSVGLFGEWGSGKTHLLKLIESSINTIQLDDNASKETKKTFPQTTIPIFFNAWRFEKEEHMIVPLFQTLLSSMEEYEHRTLGDEAKKILSHTLIKLKVLGKALSKGLKIPDKLGEIPTKIKNLDATVITDVLNVESISKEYEKKVKEELVDDELFKELTEQSRLESVYYKIPEWIEKITIADNINFVFLIDDLDRCLPENTLKMLESIKLFLDVPSCAFVLAIDDDVVERGVAYHYRDYLQQNNNIIINLDKKEEEKQEQKVTELPITGHEYLEKMIQLPFWIPVIDGTDVYDFLQKNYGQKISELLDSEKEQLSDMQERGDNKSKSEEVLKFFSEAIPPKPRKIKRTAMLFQTKVSVLQALEQNIDHMVIAKLTLLELFAPKLLRFIQNNGYKAMFDILCDFSNMKLEDEHDEKTTLANQTRIKNWIEKENDEDKERIHTKLMEIVTENYHSRMVFKLDHVFKERIDKDILAQVIEQKMVVKLADTEKVVISLMSKKFKELLFGESETQWRAAFDDHELFEEGKALLTVDSIADISNEAKEKEGFCDNPKWLLIIAEYITQPQFKKLLDDIYPYEMNKYQTKFEEYDEYCEATGAKKPSDNTWGRGKRPVINVSWEDATAYAKWLSEKEGVEYRLPTSDEWYLACNVGAKTKWHFGDDENLLKDYAWYNENSDGKTHSVGELKPNALGLYDMHGNVWEWCENWYDEKKEKKVLRGGSWNFDSYASRSAYRNWGLPTYRYYDVGFRLLRTLP